MPKRILYGLGAVLFLFSVTLIVWQGSFRFPASFGSFGPDDTEEIFVFYGISILIFLLMVTLGFYLVRLIWKLWIERRSDHLGSRIRTKLVVGALLLSLMPVVFMVLFSVDVLSNTISKWFSRPAQHELVEFDKIARALDRQMRDRAEAEAELLAANPDTKLTLAGLAPDSDWLARFCNRRGIVAASLIPAESDRPIASFGTFPGPKDPPAIVAEAPVERSKIRIAMTVPVDVVQQQQALGEYHHAFDQLSSQRRAIWHNYLWLLALIALFVFVVAGWLAHFLARQISGPISALLRAIEEISKGNLGYRVKVNAVDELALLVSGFNKMTGDLEANRSEIEARRRFTEAILESIPTGVISVDSNGRIQLVNKALAEIFPESDPRHAARLEDLFGREDAAEIRYLMNRARRVGHANQQLEVKTAEKTVHLAVTVSAIEGRRGSGFVIVIEDTSDLLQAQKIAAWSEVARRVAHEIRNPLTPITLSAERIVRQIGRLPASGEAGGLPVAVDKVVRECAAIILDETASVKRLVDEFSEFSRLPAAQPVTCELNDVVANGIGVFEGRLEGIDVHVDLAAQLPAVSIDPEQFQRVVVNLIDNAAEAMQDSPVRILSIQTRPGLADTIEIIFADTGCGVTPEQKEKLFLPYFSTKGRGTGLGLAIVSHILAEHNASIRVEDNKPCGAWFTVEVPVAQVDKQPVNRQADKDPAPVATGAIA